MHVRFFSERLSWNSVYATVDGFVRFGCGSWMARMSMLFCSMSVKIEAGEKILCMFHVAHVRVSLVFLGVFEFLFCFVLLELDFLFLLLFVGCLGRLIDVSLWKLCVVYFFVDCEV